MFTFGRKKNNEKIEFLEERVKELENKVYEVTSQLISANESIQILCMSQKQLNTDLAMIYSTLQEIVESAQAAASASEDKYFKIRPDSDDEPYLN